jgi:hypothetical protein
MKHKWHKEIKAWADGAEIEVKQEQGGWIGIDNPGWYDYEEYEYRIKPQPKEPQYLYVYKAMGGEVMIESKPSAYCGDCIGKIKLEVDDA